MTDRLTVQELQKVVDDYVSERGWKKYHKPKDLALSLAVESSELLEIFQWKPDPIESGGIEEELKGRIGEELADTVIYAVCMANAIGLDLSKALLDKIENNRRKYPVDEVSKARDWEEVQALIKRPSGNPEDD